MVHMYPHHLIYSTPLLLPSRLSPLRSHGGDGGESARSSSVGTRSGGAMDRSGGVTTGSGMGAQLFPLGEGARWPARSSDASAWQVIPRELEALNHEHPRSPTTSRGNRRGNDADGGWSEIGARRLDPGAGQGGRPAMAGASLQGPAPDPGGTGWHVAVLQDPRLPGHTTPRPWPGPWASAPDLVRAGWENTCAVPGVIARSAAGDTELQQPRRIR
ncbi:unnamed protein product [Urochloa humidicola]